MSDQTDNLRSGSRLAPNGTSEAEKPSGLMDQVEDMQSLMEAQESGGFRALRRRQTTKGVVVSVGEDAVLVDVGTKSEGIIPRDELSEMGEPLPELTYGQEILVQVLEPDGRDGPVLSLKRARREQAWVDLEELARDGAIITAVVVDHNRGGAILDVRGLRGFVPLSQLSSLPPPSQSEGDDTQDRLAQLHGQRLTVKILEADQTQNQRLILSERAAADELRAQRRAELLAQIEPGQIRKGKIRSVTNFGAFVDLGGADGLVHVSELSYDRVQDPRTVVKTGDEVDVYVLEVRAEDGRISLSMKRAMLDPWSLITLNYQPGQVVDATITRILPFGAFAQIEPGVEGLIHISELADSAPKDPSQVVQSGQTVQVKIIHIDQRDRKLGLSLRQVNPVPAERDMTAAEWHAEQERQWEDSPSAFNALSHLRNDTSEPPPERRAEQAPTEDLTPDSDAETEGSDSEVHATETASTDEPAAQSLNDSETAPPSSELVPDTVTETVERGTDSDRTESAMAEAGGTEQTNDVKTTSKERPKRARRSKKATEAEATEEAETEVADPVSPSI